ncbi:MAG: DUF4292 domain-containing protein [Flavobacteriales bacterium]|nr:DUF4292 domain-containing protein [Flavobacteriales bacterium]MCB9191761.1 DUF4292 domain-containing protein [Flavobacteriales bacterium]MCB9203577.1 DUF4292 domain-containing protein [Flavobacteriales bacterium]
MKRTLDLLLVMALASFVYGCKTSKLASTPSGLPQITTQALLDSVNNNSFSLMSAKLAVSHSNAKGTQNFGARIRVKKDSVIWLSVTPALGIEAVRVVITPDSIKMVNRIEQKYFVESFEKTNELLQLQLTYSVLQSVLLGEFVPVYDNKVYNLTPLVDLYTLVADEKKAQTSTVELKLDQRTEFDPSIWRVTRTILKNPPRNEEILAQYTDFERVGEKIFPTTMRFRTQGKDNIAVDLNWSKIEEKTTLRFPFNVPNKYAPY